MRTSTLYLGADPSYESEARRVTRTDLRRLHTAAQRIAWGVLMGNRIPVDLDEQADVLLRNHDGEPTAHVAVAFARAAQGRHDDASAQLERARACSSPDHPWARIVPDANALFAPKPAPELLEEVPGRVYRVVSAKDLPGIPFANLNVMTLLRMRSGELVCINPVAIDDELAARIRALGDVTHIVSPAKYHSEQIPRAQEAFPRARTWGVPGQKGYAQVASIRFDGFLDDRTPLFPGELDQITMHGVDVGDVWFIDRASRTLLVTDAVFMRKLVPGAEHYTSPFSVFYGWAWGVYDRIGIPTYQPPMWKDVRAYQASLQRALEHDFDGIASTHGPWRCTDGDGRTELARAVAWLLDLGRVDAFRLVGDFAARHPGIFLTFVREQVALLRANARATAT